MAHARGVCGFDRGGEFDSGAEFDRAGDSYWASAEWVAGADRGGDVFHCPGNVDGDRYRVGVCTVWEVAAGAGDSLRGQADNYRRDRTGVWAARGFGPE